MAWRKDMSRNYVTGTLRELAGLPPSFVPPADDYGNSDRNGSSGLHILSNGPFA
jgi:hypothetical protein